jgi:large subunit ribosomal protein L35
MPKMKSHRGAAKRFKKTGTGKIVRMQQGMRHILTKKSKKRKRQLRKDSLVSTAEVRRVHQLLPYL